MRLEVLHGLIDLPIAEKQRLGMQCKLEWPCEDEMLDASVHAVESERSRRRNTLISSWRKSLVFWLGFLRSQALWFFNVDQANQWWGDIACEILW